MMNFEQQCSVKYQLSNRWINTRNETDFRSWNLSRWTAHRALVKNIENFGTENCPDYVKYGSNLTQY